MPARDPSRKTSRRLVIDASVARASGGPNATFPASKRCRDVLTSVLEICHQVVRSPAIGDEWRRHESRFARKWLVSMYARRKVVEIAPAPNERLRDRVQELVRSEANRREAAKDLPLLEAALATDGIVLSLDDSARAIFAGVAEEIVELGRIRWINPELGAETVIDGISADARRASGVMLR